MRMAQCRELLVHMLLTAGGAGLVREGRFEINVGKTSMGADISAFSQFEDKKEYLYAPLTHIELVGQPRVERSEGRDLSVLRVRLTVNQRTKTVEQAERMRINFLEHLSSSLESEVRLRAMRVWIDLVKCAGRHVGGACMSVLAFTRGCVAVARSCLAALRCMHALESLLTRLRFARCILLGMRGRCGTGRRSTSCCSNLRKR